MSIRTLYATMASVGTIVMIPNTAMAQIPTPVSEPGTLGLIVLGIGIAALVARRNRK